MLKKFSITVKELFQKNLFLFALIVKIFKKVELWGYKAYITDKSCSSGSEKNSI